ncbi:FtsK/SpoIIIE domain-containing protein, partial [Klebsiella pneumoniae]|uniref:FtsK/SpoIIIE domain-containing protein n=1 Tax=Klebsiella pneumoniae TaxID=573 RepID=UPI0013D1CD3D
FQLKSKPDGTRIDYRYGATEHGGGSSQRLSLTTGWETGGFHGVIGIELPNAARESVNLHELVASQAFEDQGATLPLVLGKNIAGDPVIADLAPMPHLLVAGTT